MAGHDDLGVVLLHGLPQNAGDPFAPLISLQNKLASLIPAQNIFPYYWAQAFGKDLNSLVIRGQLGLALAPNFHRQLKAYQDDHPLLQRWVIGNYSSGGWGFYQWLIGWNEAGQFIRPPQEQLAKIVFAFTIASPYRNIHDTFQLAGKPRTARKWETDAEHIARALPPGTLHIIFSPDDTTVWPDNAQLSAFSQAARGLVDAHLVFEEPIPGATHDSILYDQRTIDYIADSLAVCLKSRPAP